MGVLTFLCFKFEFEHFLFFGLLKHYKIGVLANVCGFCCEKEEKGKKQRYLELLVRVFWVQKWPFRDAYLFPKKELEKQNLFYSVFWVRVFWAKLSKKKNFGHPPKKRILTDN